jgi:hypothetical protein
LADIAAESGPPHPPIGEQRADQIVGPTLARGVPPHVGKDPSRRRLTMIIVGEAARAVLPADLK